MDHIHKDKIIDMSAGQAGGRHTSEFRYDGLDRRVGIVETENGVEQSNHVFIWYGSQIAQKRDSTGSTVERNYFAGGFEEDGNDYYYTKDHLGSIREVVASDGTTVESVYDYSPWGGVSKVTGNGVESDFLYTGHFYHGESDLHLTLYRAYNPELGMWLSRDPIAENGGINLYAYVGNDPINWWDPLGLDACVLNDSDAVFGAGHNASLVGNDQDGWLYTSKNGESAGGVESFDAHAFDTFDDFMSSPMSSGYDRIARLPTTPAQDKAMQQEALNSVGREYSVGNFGPRGGENCSAHVDNVNDAGGIPDNGRLRPNRQFESFSILPGVVRVR